MTTEHEAYRQPSATGAIVAGGVIVALTMIFCTLLLIWFWHPCCCCCQRPQATGSSVTEFSAPNPHISGSAVNRFRGYPGQSRQQAVILPAGERAAAKADDARPNIAPGAQAQDEYFYDEVGTAPGGGGVPQSRWWPDEYIGAVPAESSTVPAHSPTSRNPVEVPEPGSLAMMLAGLPVVLALAVGRRPA